jgi:selT/selW/selH-like putative selenoprotein
VKLQIKQTTGIDAELIAGGGGIFDIAVNGELVFSKHQAGGYPDEEALARQIAVL